VIVAGGGGRNVKIKGGTGNSGFGGGTDELKKKGLAKKRAENPLQREMMMV